MEGATEAPDTRLADLSPYVYGTTRLGHPDTPRSDRVRTARAAMDAGIWFHTSRQYDDALEVLATAFSEDRSRIPPVIVKIGSDSIAGVRSVIAENMEPLGIDHIEIGQLSFHGELADQVRTGEAIPHLQQIKRDGLVGRFVWEVFPWTSSLPLEVTRSGIVDDLIEGFIFYLNPLQRFATNQLWDQLIEQEWPIVAMRTVAGGPVHRLRDEPGFAWKEYLQQRATDVAPLFEQSGLERWTDFCVRFAHSHPQVMATVGSTASTRNLDEFLNAATSPIEPLPSDITGTIAGLQRRWSDELDSHVEPWTM